MYEKVANGPGGPGDTLPPLQFQQQFNLPLVGTNSTDSWNASSSDPYSNGANSADPYSSWANYSQQWSQCRTKKLGFHFSCFLIDLQNDLFSQFLYRWRIENRCQCRRSISDGTNGSSVDCLLSIDELL